MLNHISLHIFGYILCGAGSVQPRGYISASFSASAPPETLAYGLDEEHDYGHDHEGRYGQQQRRVLPISLHVVFDRLDHHLFGLMRYCGHDEREFARLGVVASGPFDMHMVAVHGRVLHRRAAERELRIREIRGCVVVGSITGMDPGTVSEAQYRGDRECGQYYDLYRDHDEFCRYRLHVVVAQFITSLYCTNTWNAMDCYIVHEYMAP